MIAFVKMQWSLVSQSFLSNPDVFLSHYFTIPYFTFRSYEKHIRGPDDQWEVHPVRKSRMLTIPQEGIEGSISSNQLNINARPF